MSHISLPHDAKAGPTKAEVRAALLGKLALGADDETETFCRLDEATDHGDEVGGMGTSLIVGNHETEVWANDYEQLLVTPRGGRDVEDF